MLKKLGPKTAKKPRAGEPPADKIEERLAGRRVDGVGGSGDRGLLAGTASRLRCYLVVSGRGVLQDTPKGRFVAAKSPKKVIEPLSVLCILK